MQPRMASMVRNNATYCSSFWLTCGSSSSIGLSHHKPGIAHCMLFNAASRPLHETTKPTIKHVSAFSLC